MDDKAGKIITFYSYKGGTGRTMALANVGWILASNGFDVLLIDWDLEAPGLHRFIRPFLIDSELTATPGLIDFVWESVRVSMTPTDGAPPAAKFPSLDDYAVVLDHDFADGGTLSYIPAGRQDENYAQRVNTFNWDDFYQRFRGGKVMQAERDALRTKYDYILIDSRTGVSDTSGICTVQMPDALVVLFTLNRQSITGASAVAASIDATVRTKRGASIPIYPVPTRIENAETERRGAAIAYARRAFAPLLTHVQALDPAQQTAYWNDVETPYIPFFAFEEIPAVFKEETGTRNTVLGATERVACRLTGQTVALHSEDDQWRNDIIAAYALKEGEAPRIEWKPPPPPAPAPPPPVSSISPKVSPSRPAAAPPDEPPHAIAPLPPPSAPQGNSMPEKSELYPADNPAVTKHVDVLQGIITRLANNSASCKTWCLTLVGALLSLAGATKMPVIGIVVIVPILIFRYIDIKYLATEKAFREKYNNIIRLVRNGEYAREHVFDVSLDRQATVAAEPHARASWSVRVYCWLLCVYGAYLLYLIAWSIDWKFGYFSGFLAPPPPVAPKALL
jgi:MinD-like ATPase involved in chromosome partitioning or flagellar assembly